MGELPKPEVSLGDKPPEDKIPQVTTVTTTIKEKKKANYFLSVEKIQKPGFNKQRGILRLMRSRSLST